MKIIGRQEERRELENLAASGKPEFLVVYGRRRVGKTFLVREFFGDDLFFHHTGVADKSGAVQLAEFNRSLRRCAGSDAGEAKDWFDAFDRLRELVERSDLARKVVFLDELPWMDTRRSRFIPALEHFWNGWASGRDDLFLIVCGSATSWIINRLVRNRGGLYNRLTGRLFIRPFTLKECEEYFREANIVFSRYQMLESYMAFGGIPYYLSLMKKELGFSQNVDRLCFRENGPLRDEYDLLYRSLFENAEGHMAIVETLGRKASGMTREELLKASGMSDGGGFTRVLRELEQSGFILKYPGYGKKTKDAVYQMFDFFTLFHLKFIRGNDSVSKSFWSDFTDHGARRAWTGYAFELVALAHVDQIKRKLQIGGVMTRQYAWRSRNTKPGAQIDMVIDRNDGIVNLCEMKYANDTFEIDARYERELRRKTEVFRKETGTKKALHTTFVTTYGLEENEYADGVQSGVTMEDLFA